MKSHLPKDFVNVVNAALVKLVMQKKTRHKPQMKKTRQLQAAQRVLKAAVKRRTEVMLSNPRRQVGCAVRNPRLALYQAIAT